MSDQKKKKKKILKKGFKWPEEVLEKFEMFLKIVRRTNEWIFETQMHKLHKDKM